MNPDLLFHVTLLLSTLLCGLVAGIVLAFAIVVMPGIHTLEDRDYIRAFQAIDGTIQNNQPLFLVVWIGSALTLLAASIAGIWQLVGIERAALLLLAAVYITGVHVPTIAINIPLNNRLQSVDTMTADDNVLRAERATFASRWTFWNTFRTVIASLVSAALITLLYLL